MLPEQYLLPSQDVSVQPAELNSPGKLIYKLQSRDSVGEAIEHSQLTTSANREKSDITNNCNQSSISNTRKIHSKPVCKIPCSRNYTHWYLSSFVHILHKGVSSPWQSWTVRSTAVEVLPSHIFPMLLSFGGRKPRCHKICNALRNKHQPFMLTNIFGNISLGASSSFS